MRFLGEGWPGGITAGSVARLVGWGGWEASHEQRTNNKDWTGSLQEMLCMIVDVQRYCPSLTRATAFFALDRYRWLPLQLCSVTSNLLSNPFSTPVAPCLD